MTGEKKPKEIEGSSLTVTKVIKTEYDTEGNPIVEYLQDELVKKPFSIGSLNKPIKDLKKIKYNIPPKRQKINLLDGFSLG